MIIDLLLRVNLLHVKGMSSEMDPAESRLIR